ncbi:MAG: kinase [Hungatella sp.]|jgi:tight adherence protein B|nr:kinase [Hungatella sp.]
MFGRNKAPKAEKKPKKAKKQKEVYVPIPGIMGLGEDYHIYHMTLADRFMAAGFGVAGAVAIGYVFFNSLIAAGVIALGGALFLQKPFEEYQKKKRLKKLLLEFKDLLETLTSSYSAGQTTSRAFADAQSEMSNLYGEEADIVAELKMINAGLQHNYNIEDLLLNFAARSGLDDVDSFANVFEVCNRKGGNLKQIVGETRSVINDKIEIEMEIQTMVAASRNELNIMMVMPFIIMFTMRGLGDSMTDNSMINLAVKFIALGIFAGAYVLGLKLVDIKL